MSCDSIEEVLAIESAAVEAIKDFKVEKEEIITSTEESLEEEEEDEHSYSVAELEWAASVAPPVVVFAPSSPNLKANLPQVRTF